MFSEPEGPALPLRTLGIKGQRFCFQVDSALWVDFTKDLRELAHLLMVKRESFHGLDGYRERPLHHSAIGYLMRAALGHSRLGRCMLY